MWPTDEKLWLFRQNFWGENYEMLSQYILLSQKHKELQTFTLSRSSQLWDFESQKYEQKKNYENHCNIL